MSDFVAGDDPWHTMLDAVSLHDWSAYEDAATGDYFGRRPCGGVPRRLCTAVTRVDRRGTWLRLETTGGMIEATRAIVAVPTTVLAEERITFDPPLTDRHAAAAVLPLGLSDNVFLLVVAPVCSAEAHLIGDLHSACMPIPAVAVRLTDHRVFLRWHLR